MRSSLFFPRAISSSIQLFKLLDLNSCATDLIFKGLQSFDAELHVLIFYFVYLFFALTIMREKIEFDSSEFLEVFLKEIYNS